MNFKEFIEDANQTFKELEASNKCLYQWKEWYVERFMSEDHLIVQHYFLASPSEYFLENGIEGTVKLCRDAHERTPR